MRQGGIKKTFERLPILGQMAVWQFPLMGLLAYEIGLSVLGFWLGGHLASWLKRWWQQLPVLSGLIFAATQIVSPRTADFFILLLVFLLPMTWRLEVKSAMKRPLSPAGLTVTIFLVGSVFIYQTQFIILLALIAWLLSFLLWFAMALTGFSLSDIKVRWLPVVSLSVISAGLIVFLFTVIPRIDTGFVPGLADKTQEIRLIDQLSAGGMSDLLADDEIAFRAFPMGEQKKAPSYWRVYALTFEKEGVWQRLAERPVDSRKTEQAIIQALATGRLEYDYRIVPDKHDMSVPPVPDWPYRSPSGYEFNRYGELVPMNRMTSTLLPARLTGQIDSTETRATGPASYGMPFEGQLQLSDQNPRLQQWAIQVRAQYPDERAFIDYVLNFFTDNFEYQTTLTLPEDNPLDALFFEVKQGYCSGFASAFTTILRAGGIPAHIAAGYLGGTWNPYGNYWVVRNRDAHAWVEAQLSDGSWIRLDPTLQVIPAAEQRLQNFAEAGFSEIGGRDIPQAPREMDWNERLRQTGLWLDSLNIAATQAILNYGGESSSSDKTDWQQRLVFGAIGLAMALVSISVLVVFRRFSVRDTRPVLERQLEKLLTKEIAPRPDGQTLPAYVAHMLADKPHALQKAGHALASQIYQMRFDTATAQDMNRMLNKDWLAFKAAFRKAE